MSVDIKDFLDVLQQNAHNALLASKTQLIIDQKQTQIAEWCDTNFTLDQKQILNEIHQLQTEIETLRHAFLYRRAFGDCVSLLKALQILQ